MVTFLAGGTGTPKLLDGATRVWDPDETAVVANTGDDVELGGHLVCPDVDTVLFAGGGVLDRETWWGIADDTTETHAELRRIAAEVGLGTAPRYLDAEAQTTGREIARWRRFSGVGEFMEIGDRDRAVHVTRTSLLDEGRTLTEAIRALADAFGLDVELLPMSDDPVATLVHTAAGETIHFQEYWVARRGEPAVADVEFRGADDAEPTDAVLDALADPVVIGPSNPVTSLGPMLALPGFEAALRETPVVAVSPFVGDEVFSGPAADLMAGVGRDPSTAGVAAAYPFADAFVLDDDDPTELPERRVEHTDTRINDAADAERVARACERALTAVSETATTDAEVAE
ncbi:2-phospho-L-lactate transferase [Halorubrum sp. Boch-26]|uniref:2-phospho-L-lactate transferase n=1 Tax=Halorubrum sp. Boch-26 TaxID=2994426 RepID=UPI0024682D45|nr:2-phospho-L-lactate transferase [Halorubrum sp. Boch-26]